MRAAYGRHARVTWSFIALALMLPACAEQTSNSDTETPAVVTERGVEIRDVERDETRRTVAANVSRDGIERRLTLAPLRDGPSPGVVASIADDGSFFELAIGVDERTGTVWLRERTATDEMFISVRQQGGRVFEAYEINGARLAFDRPALPVAQLDKAVARYRAGELALSPSPEMQEMADRLARFDAFYTPTVTNSLHHNPEGELLVGLLTDPAVAGLVTGEWVEPLRNVTPAERVCYLASLCVSFKARFAGGLANPIVASCIGTFVACVFTEIACWFIGCDCCF